MAAMKQLIERRDAEGCAFRTGEALRLGAKEIAEIEAAFRQVFVGEHTELSTAIGQDPDFHSLTQELMNFLAESPRRSDLIEARIPSRKTQLSREKDWLASAKHSHVFTVLNAAANSMVAKNHSFAVVTSIKDEGPWFLEWLAHYKAIGAENIFVYSNNARLEDNNLLNILAEHGEIFWILNEVEPSTSPQKKSFQDAIWRNHFLSSHKYVLFCDADEFLISKDECDPVLQSGFLLGAGDAFDNLVVNWEWIGDRSALRWDEGLVIDRFVNGAVHNKKKCVFRPECAVSMHQVHFPIMLEGSRSCGADGSVILDITSDTFVPLEPKVLLRHYFAKSFEEFLLKVTRGRGAVGRNVEPRVFDNFLWGQVGLEFSPFPVAGRQKLTAVLDRLRSLPELRQAELDVLSAVRAEVSGLYSKFDVPSVFASLR